MLALVSERYWRVETDTSVSVSSIRIVLWFLNYLPSFCFDFVLFDLVLIFTQVIIFENLSASIIMEENNVGFSILSVYHVNIVVPKYFVVA